MPRLVKIAALVSALGLLAQPAMTQAALDGNRFTSDLHKVRLERPDGSWELRQGLPLPHSVAAFVVGDGSAAAVLIHRIIDRGEAITDAADFSKRRETLAEEIAVAGTGQNGPFSFDRVEFSAADDRINFDLFFGNRESGRGALENWVSGFIVRDKDDLQHIFAVRCAVTRGTFQSWASQFERIVPTLAFVAEVKSPVYTSRPIPTWVWIGGGVALLMLLGFLRGRTRDVRQLHVAGAKVRTPAAPYPTAQGQPLPPVDFESTAPISADEQDVPDIIRMTSGGGMSAPPDPMNEATLPHAASHTSQMTEVSEDTQPDAGGGYWTCSCGRKNPNVDSFCSRCNADRG